jgi:hypothetical protein
MYVFVIVFFVLGNFLEGGHKVRTIRTICSSMLQEHYPVIEACAAGLRVGRKLGNAAEVGFDVVWYQSIAGIAAGEYRNCCSKQCQESSFHF